MFTCCIQSRRKFSKSSLQDQQEGNISVISNGVTSPAKNIEEKSNVTTEPKIEVDSRGSIRSYKSVISSTSNTSSMSNATSGGDYYSVYSQDSQ
ncbi:hypothetical protein WA026_022452 [Henosepilachna vigintioctopunctata]|uniref:Uncharacterized protein n=1 Tax=Henosepilachna vigintioctopunctata TaxID=420089 RepID=A0AAW1U1X9_9CUCU